MGRLGGRKTENNQVELYPSSGVYCNADRLNRICTMSKMEPKKLIRFLLEMFFDEQYLGDHCAKGRAVFGSGEDSRPAIDPVILEAIKGYVLRQFPKFTDTTFTHVVNSKCSDSRRALKTKQQRLKKT